MSKGVVAQMARRKKIGIIDLENVIKEILNEYGDEVYKVLGLAEHEVAEEAARKLQAGGSYGGTGAYKRDWTFDQQTKKRFRQSYIVHNADHYRLAHLLEKGHVSRNGTGRTFGNVKAYPHIKPVEEWAQQELPRKVEEMLNTQ